MLYVVGVLLVKRSTDFGVGVWRTTFIANITSAIVFLSLLLLGGQIPSASLLWQPAVTAALFLAGQILTFQAIQKGDVSIATPVLGLKIIMVALFSTLLLHEPVGIKLWISAGLSSLAIALLNASRGEHHHHVRGTIISAFLAALSFALFDVLVAKWATPWGAGRFLPIMMGMVGVASFGLLPFFHAPLKEIPQPAWNWLLSGSFCIALQAVGFITTVAVFKSATAANVVYSARGLWSVVGVWMIGHWFQNREQSLGPVVLRTRLIGALLLLAAILLVLR